MKKLIVAAVLLVALASALSVGACGGDKVPAGAIAAVGSSGVVTQAQFDQIWKQAEAQYANTSGAPPFPKKGTTQYDQLKALIVDYLVQNELLKQEASGMGVSVTAKELNGSIKQVVQGAGGQKKLDALLKKQGLTMSDVKAQLEARLLLDKMKTKVAENTKVSEEKIKAYFNDPKNKQQFVTPESVDVRHVMLKTKADALRIEKLLKADSSDANWKKVAKRYSKDPGSKKTGGALGTRPKGSMLPEFEKVAFSIKPGTVSAPVKSQFGYHVIEVLKRTPGSSKTYAEAKPMIEAQLKYQAQATAWDTWLKDAESKVGIVYALGFDPATLTASPSPSGSAAPSPSSTK